MTTTLVTGANSGIGRATALELAGQGHDVFASMRNTDKAAKLLELASAAGVRVEVVQLDVSDDASVRDGVASVLERAGSIDVLVNNAGVGYNAVTEDLDLDRTREVFEVNFFGLIRCAQAVLPQMRERGSGHIVNVTSITGKIAALAQTAYSSSKWAAECASEALAQELAPFGIRVSIIEPGVTRTAILPKNSDSPGDSAYDMAYRRLFSFYAAGIAANVQPDVVARTIHEAITDPTPRLRYTCAWGGDTIPEGRERMSDEEWVALGAITDDATYAKEFSSHFGVDVTPFVEG
ncbi:MAG: SDR family oxidoreductase [Actinomycetota bacterium]|nr:SDR family oxidoreductase [Actinomycetota bacterium]